jgi:hypothetical protein
LISLREVFEDEEDRKADEVTTRVSEIVSWRGRAMFGGREIECCLRSIKDSRVVAGSESKVGDDAKKNDEERRYGVTLVMGNWSLSMSEVRKSLASLRKDIKREFRGSEEPLSSDEERPDTQMSITLSNPASRRSSIDNLNPTEALRISIANALIKIFESSLSTE